MLSFSLSSFCFYNTSFFSSFLPFPSFLTFHFQEYFFLYFCFSSLLLSFFLSPFFHRNLLYFQFFFIHTLFTSPFLIFFLSLPTLFSSCSVNFSLSSYKKCFYLFQLSSLLLSFYALFPGFCISSSFILLFFLLFFYCSLQLSLLLFLVSLILEHS